jgi:hypothetical protein
VTDDVPLYQRDPEAWQAHLADGNRRQPRKRVGADVLFRDATGRILLVDLRYKPDWDVPGGMAEANEPPLDCARREVKEELGIEYQGGRALVIDWVAPCGPWHDSLMFIFDGGVVCDARCGAPTPAALRVAPGPGGTPRIGRPGNGVPTRRTACCRPTRLTQPRAPNLVLQSSSDGKH